MKNIKYFLSIFAVLLLLTSCSEDENPINDVQLPAIPATQTTVDLTINESAYYGSGDIIDYAVAFANSASSDIQVNTQATSDYPEATYLSYVNTGESSSAGSFAIPENSLSFSTVGAYAISVVGARTGTIVLDEDEVFDSFDPSGGDTAITTSDIVTISPLYDAVPAIDAEGLNILYDWQDPTTHDIDMEIFPADEQFFDSPIESSGSGSRYEGVVFDNTHPDDNYVIYLTVFTASPSSDIPGRMFLTAPNGERTLLEFDIPAGSPSQERFPVISFTKTGDIYSNIVIN